MKPPFAIKSEFLSDVERDGRLLARLQEKFKLNLNLDKRYKGIAYVLKNRGLPPDEEREFIGQLEASLEKLSMLIEEMLIVADMDRGTLSLELTDLDLAPLLRQVAEEIGRQFPDVTIEREIPEMEQQEAIILRVKPGITGIWQVTGRNLSTFQERVQLDVEYVRNWSPWLDIYVLARTVPVVVGGTGS